MTNDHARHTAQQHNEGENLNHYEYHPLANIFPLIDGPAYQELMADVMRHGVREPVWLYEGQILDGRNRYRAAQAMGVECPTREYDGEDPTGFVVSLNLHRRHLSESQRAMVAAKLANMKQGQRTDIEPSANLQNVSQSDAAELLSVSPRSVASAAKVQAEASPEVVQAVEQGAMSVSLAAKVVDLPEEDRAEIAAAPAEAMREVAQEAVKRAHVANNSGNNEWYTPAKYVELARKVMGGIDTDPATSDVANRTVKAKRIYTAEDDGRGQQWEGRVWMNPPYAQPLMSDFAEAVTSKYQAGEIKQACILVNNATETQWFQRMLEAASAVCLPKSRIKFVDPQGNPSGAPLQGQAIIYMGDRVKSFAAAFSDEGAVLMND